MAETETPDRKKTPPKARVSAKAKKATSVASFAVPEVKAAGKVVSAKKVAAKKTASSGEKAVQKTKSPESTKTPEKAPEPRPSRPQRAANATKSAASRRVASARESHRKTASAVEGKYRKEKVLGLAEMRPKTRMLAAEYMAAIVMAMILLFIPGKSYHEKMARFFIQMTGISGIFFVLALASSSNKTAKYAIPFGLLIDVSMLVYLFNQGAGKTISDVVGKPDVPAVGGGGGGQVRAVSDVTTNQYAVPHYGEPSQIAPNQTINPPETHLGGEVVV